MGTPGRPSRINEVIATRTTPDGRTIEVTVADRIVEALVAGNYMEGACAMAGIHKSVVYGWLTTAATCTTALTNGTRTRRSLTAHEKRCLEFSDAVDEAQHLSEATDVTRLAQLAGGGYTTTTRTVKALADGTEETTTRTETHGPNAAVLMWRLERKNPRRWGRRTVELSGPDGGPIPVAVEAQGVERLLSLVERMDEAVGAEPDELEPVAGTGGG